MAFEYPTVTFGSINFSVYADLDAATNYLIASIAEGGIAWGDAETSEELKKKALVTATRWLDQASWIGAQTDSVTPQDLAWPRTGIDGIESDVLPTNLIDASIELAALLIVSPDLRANLAAPLAREQHAGPAGISYFRPRDVQTLSFFPKEIDLMVAQWLKGTSVAGAIPTDVCERSSLDRPFDFDHGI